MVEEKRDPIGEEYYKPLLCADHLGDGLFLVSAVLSIAALLVDKSSYPSVHEVVHITFILSVIALFATNVSIRLYFFPRAQVARYRDFLAHAYDKQLSHKMTAAYYNNSATTVAARIAAQVLESTFFTKSILSHMARSERLKIAAYSLVWFGAVFHRTTGLEIIAVVAQIVFSEQLLSRWLRFEAYKSDCEKIYAEFYRLFQQNKAKIDVAATEFLGRYEIVKATTALSLSSSVFDRERAALGAEWDEVRKTLGI